MTTVGCPVCNGLTALDSVCSECHSPLQDTGRLENYYGDYSPYRDIDDLRITNNLPDLQHHCCVHVLYCNRCNREDIVCVHEITLP